MGGKAKFKIGDRVLVTANEDGEGEGKTAVVVWVCSPDWVHVRFEQPIDGWGEDGQEWGVGAEKLELLPVAEATGTLKDGDIVRCIEDYDGQFTAGKEYVVRRVYNDRGFSRILVLEDDRGSKSNGWLASKFVPVRRSLDEPVKTWLEKEIESGRMSVDAARAQLGHDPVPTDTAGYTVPLCAYEDDPGWYATELGRAYADGYAAGLKAGGEDEDENFSQDIVGLIERVERLEALAKHSSELLLALAA